MKKITLTKGKEALVDDQDYEFLMRWKWHAACGGKYAGRRPKSGAIYMHQLIAKRMGFENIPDHIDGNGLDNRRANLRPATHQLNLANRGPQVNNTSGFKGVTYDKARGKWFASIKVQGKRYNLGRFDDKVEAARVYNKAAKKHFGEFAWLNPIPGE